MPALANKPLAVSRLMLRVAVGLLTDHTTLRGHKYKLGLTHSKTADCVGTVKKKTVYMWYVPV